ncbi:cell division protein ZipA [Aliiglaciecola lipolytica]|uniref:Cell division protein ZipA n=1 Tax=Aliiglaciecola lipolytica E3 TaxID=1127673 RepID=K6YTM6_9ALTE|nr:cell division protein ZipA [Aliiglaciecola lipolytica]GAC14645.1 cell division protein ZipA [Aliiglaciecola lipolytica E3]
MEELRLAFLVIGAIAIIGILIHGMWSVRKNAQDKGHASLETQDWEEDYDDDEIEDVDLESDSDVIEFNPKRDKIEPNLSDDNFDELGIGAVRVVSTAAKEPSSTDTPSAEQAKNEEPQDVAETDMSKTADEVIKQDSPASKPKIYSSVVTQPKPEYAAQQVQAMRSRMSAIESSDTADIPEPPPFLLKTSELEAGEKPPKADSTTDFSAPVKEPSSSDKDDKPVVKTANNSEQSSEKESEVASTANSEGVSKMSLADQARNFVKRSKSEPKTRKRREPQIREDQMKIDFDEPEAEAQTTVKPATNSDHVEENVQQQEQQVLVINVKANDDNPIQGAALLPMLLTLGFKFGDQDIFHRHVNSNGKGPVLFSLANMFKPGVFDIDNLENFNTLGVSLFMMLPIEGDPHQVFNMMHNAARKIADEFSAQVLDGRRSALTKQSLQQYVEKIREFERKRMIAR